MVRQLPYPLGKIGGNALGLEKRGQTIGTPSAGTGTHPEAADETALREHAGAVLQHVAGQLDIPDLQGVLSRAMGSQQGWTTSPSSHGERGKQKKRKRRTYAPDNPAQSRKFIEAAKKLGVDTDGKAFEQAMRNLLKPKGGNS